MDGWASPLWVVGEDLPLTNLTNIWVIIPFPWYPHNMVDVMDSPALVKSPWFTSHKSQIYHGYFMDIQIFTSNFPWTNPISHGFSHLKSACPMDFSWIRKKHHHRAAQDLFGGRVVPSHEPHVHLTPHRRNDEICQGQVGRSTWIPSGQILGKGLGLSVGMW